MASKFACASLSVATSVAMGCVDGCWSAWYAAALRPPENVVQESVNLVASAADWNPHISANDSFSHRSSHHFIVTRLPNHICAISCRITIARTSYMASVTFDRNMRDSVIVTQPAFSMAPPLSATKTWSYLANG